MKEDEYVSDTTIFTGIASGYRIAGDNNEANNIGAENAFGNLMGLLKARDTQAEVIIRLLARHLMLKEPDPKVLSEENYERLNELLPEDLRKKLTGNTLEQTIANITAYHKANNENEIARLLISNDPVYSYDALSNLSAYREGQSEMVRLEYSSNDPAVSQHTLAILTDVFVRKHKNLFDGRTETVIAFFDEATREAQDRLKAAEQKLLEFNKANRIVDYEEAIATTSAEKNTIFESLNNLEMEYAGAFATQKAAEQNLKKRGISNLQSQEILRLKNRLADVSNQISELEMLHKTEGKDNTAKIAELKRQEAQISENLRSTIDIYYSNTTSANGIPIDNMLDEYVRSTILVEQLKSQLNQMRKQKAAFVAEYEKLVPLGADVRTIRREIEVAEQEYLSQLDGLKQSLLTKQNLELASQVKVLDPPNYPTSSSSSRMLPLLVLFGFFGSMFLTGMGIVAKDMLDSSLRSPSLAAKITKYPVLGVMPKLDNLSKKQLAEAKRVEDHLARQLLLKFHQKQGKTPFIVGVLSAHSGEGKSTVSTALADNLNSLGIEALALFPESHAKKLTTSSNTKLYAPSQGIAPSVTFADLTGTKISTHSIVLVEFPAVLDHAYPVSLLQHLDLIMLTVRANRSWQQADKNVFESIQQLTAAPIEVVLNGVAMDYLEDFVGTQHVKPVSENEAVRTTSKAPQTEVQDQWEGGAVLTPDRT
ncbi:MAG: hypothetical protein LPK07_11040 [Hymenobacteraceae bacterium]|nr:hypothetical protein [Hymenobacteraceae bacterium]MDX5482205.1 hypothetical protein [Hymenobacteraceae bacterium]